MSPTVTVGTPKPVCPFCNKIGLPILPLRYAVARSDLGNAPRLQAPFDVTTSEMDYGGKADKLQLNGKDAHYTTRLLRSGYLYVYDQHADEWSAYVVTQGAYLYPFDPNVKPPPGGWSTPTFSCKREGDAMIARCITIEHVDKATKVWLAFSDTLWTQDTLQRHAEEDYRKAHMRCLDVAAWRDAAKAPHAASFAKLTTTVAEYATDSKTLLTETAHYVSKYLPKPYTAHSAMAFLQEQEKEAIAQLPALVRDLLPGALASNSIGTPHVETAAWAFSTQLFVPESEQAAGLQIWGNEHAAPHQPVMVALDDPAGIAMELNGLVLQRIAEITAEPEYRWKYETASSIVMLRGVVCQSAVTEESKSRIRQRRHLLTQDHGPLANPSLSEESRQKLESMVKAAGDLSDQEEAQVRHDAWLDYAARYDEKGVETYLANVQDNLAKVTMPLVGNLDTVYVAWLRSKMLTRYFTHNYDRQQVDSGEAYTALASLVISEASGRTAVAHFLSEGLGKDPTDPDQWVARASLLNHDPLIAHLKEKAADKPASWDALVDKASAFLLASVVAGNAGKLDQATGVVSRWVYAVSGPLVNHVNQAFDKALSTPGKWLPARMQIAIMGAIGKRGNPDLVMVDLHGSWTRKQAARALARTLASQAGGDELMYRSGARKAFDKLDKAGGKRTAFRGVLLVDKNEIENLSSLSKAERKAIISGVFSEVKPKQFEQMLEHSVGKLANLDVKAGIVGAVFAAVSVGSSYHALLKAEPGQTGKAAWSLGGGVSQLIGGIGETSGKLVRNVAERAPRLAGEMAQGVSGMARMAGWLEYGGRAFGVIGGLIAAGVMFYDMSQEFADDNASLAVVHMTLGTATALGAILLAFPATTLIGLAILLVVAIVQAIVTWLEDDAMQIWLNKSYFFGDHKDEGWFSGPEDYEEYKTPLVQREALQDLLAGGVR